MELQAEAASSSCLAIPSLCKWGLAKEQREGRGWSHTSPPRLQGRWLNLWVRKPHMASVLLWSLSSLIQGPGHGKSQWTWFQF